MTGAKDARKIEAAERARLIGQYEETGNEAFLRAACCLRKETDHADQADVYRIMNEAEPRGRGNVEKNDRALLDRMAILMLSEHLSRWRAAQRVAAAHPGHSAKSTAKRLDGKFDDAAELHFEVARLVLRCTGRGGVHDVVRWAENRRRQRIPFKSDN